MTRAAGTSSEFLLRWSALQFRFSELEEQFRLLEIARLQPASEPADALLARAVRERIGDDIPARLLLQLIVADRCGSLHRCLDIAPLQDLPRAIGMMGPHPRQKIGLQLQPHREFIRFRLAAGGLLEGLYFVAPTEQVLHVMTDLMRDDVCLRKISRRSKFLFQLPEEPHIQIHLGVGRAIERTYRRAGKSAR